MFKLPGGGQALRPDGCATSRLREMQGPSCGERRLINTLSTIRKYDIYDLRQHHQHQHHIINSVITVINNHCINKKQQPRPDPHNDLSSASPLHKPLQSTGSWQKWLPNQPRRLATLFQDTMISRANNPTERPDPGIQEQDRPGRPGLHRMHQRELPSIPVAPDLKLCLNA